MEDRESFSKQNPFLQLAWDSTSLGALKECPYKYYLSIVKGYSPRRAKHDLTFGIAYHSALEHYDILRAEGLNHEDAVLGTCRFALQISGTRQEGKFIPWETDIKEKSRFALVRAVIWYLEEFKDDYLKTVIRSNGRPAVELSFRFETGEIAKTGEPFLISGHLDRVVERDNSLWIVDRKTTKTTLGSRYYDNYSPGNQVSLYAQAGRLIFSKPVAGLIIDAVQLAVSFARFQRGFIPRTPGFLDEWMADTLHWILLAERYAEEQTWPMNDTACDKYGGCKFRHCCSKDPAVRQNFLESDFEIKLWDPLAIR